MNNILIASAGRRVELVKIWKDSAQKLLGSDAKVYATDLVPDLSAACQVADECFEIVRCTDPNYSSLLIEKCIEYKINIVVPTIDTELLILAESLEKFKAAGINLVISSPAFIRACSDKRRTADLFKSLAVNSPLILDANDLSFPCFMKPLGGSCSQGVKPVHSSGDLCLNDMRNPENIFQELVSSEWIEYSVDLYYAVSGKLFGCVPRQRLQTRGGEISKGVTRKDGVLTFVQKHFDCLDGAMGPITLQLFTDPTREHFLGIEINPRFGGGYPMSHAAGVNYPELLIKELVFGESPKIVEDWRADFVMLRYDAMISVEGEFHDFV